MCVSDVVDDFANNRCVEITMDEWWNIFLSDIDA